ncbi:MAG: carbon starvation protein A, partial [Lachnospiraceae bacterium]|nr:carbon starvation protein A [Lachnospiraceae bacterium]
VGKENRMFFIPMIFMLVVTVTSLVQTVIKNYTAITSGAAAGDMGWSIVRTIIACLLVILSLVLAVNSIRTMVSQKKTKNSSAADKAA